MAASEPWLTLRRTYDRALPALLDPTREVYVQVEGERILGFIVLAVCGPFAGYIQAICVSPEARGRGVGSELIAFAESRIGDVSPAVFLLVSSFNEGARALYERLGFRQVGELPDHVERGYSEILMCKQRQSWNEYLGNV
jgi:ribosomal protein S18 acetylase RimI-like enzyme